MDDGDVTESLVITPNPSFMHFTDPAPCDLAPGPPQGKCNKLQWVLSFLMKCDSEMLIGRSTFKYFKLNKMFEEKSMPAFFVRHKVVWDALTLYLGLVWFRELTDSLAFLIG